MKQIKYILLTSIFIFHIGCISLSEEQYNRGFSWKTEPITIEPILSDKNNLSIKNPKKKNEFSIMTYNIGFASGMANNRPVIRKKKFYKKNLSKIISVINRFSPDILALQEIDIASHRSYMVNQVKAVSSRTATPYSVFMPNWDKSYVPYPIWPPSLHYGKILSGLAVVSKFQIIKQNRYNLNPPENMSFIYNLFANERHIHKTLIYINGKILFVFNIHFESLSIKTREEQARYMLDIYKKHRYAPVIILGDFNSVPSYTTKFKNFHNDPDKDDYTGDTTIEIMKSEKSLKCAITESIYNGNRKKSYTFSSGSPSRKLDFIFYNDRIKFINAKVISDAGQGSDHLPIYMKFKFVE